MTQAPKNPAVAVLFSGGLDSAILLAQLLAEQHRVQPLYVDSQLHWQSVERAWATGYLDAMAGPQLAPLVTLSLPVDDLYGDHWSITGRGVPDADEADQEVYLPGRNPLLLVKAQVWCQLHGISRLAIGALRSNPFADATDDFFHAFQAAIDRALSFHVELVRPLARFDKRQVMELGARLPLGLTFSCLAPVGQLHCGRCNKCAERRGAFEQAGIVDPTHYHASAAGAAAIERSA